MSTLTAWTARDQRLLPEEDRWGRGYGGNDLTIEDLNETAATIAATPTPEGYGPRMFASQPGFLILYSTIFLPSGFDAIAPERGRGFSKHLFDIASPTDEGTWRVPGRLREFFAQEGYLLDPNGRPCNPHGPQLVADPRIGLNTNLGRSQFCGESMTADVIVTDGEKVLLTTNEEDEHAPRLISGSCVPLDFSIQARDWVAGRRRRTHEGLFKATRRLVSMHVGLPLPEDTTFTIAWGYRPTGVLQTWHAWTVNYTVLVRIPDGFAQYMPTDPENFRFPGTVWHNLEEAPLIARPSGLTISALSRPRCGLLGSNYPALASSLEILGKRSRDNARSFTFLHHYIAT